MQSLHETKVRSEKIARISDIKKEFTKYTDHLKEIIESPAFRGSHRSAQFLRFICEHAIAGDFDSLKERSIGIELFGRSPSYDTGEDAIVRVTASDVRKRLSNFYQGTEGASSELRISLPVGSYVPEFTRYLPPKILVEEDSPAPTPIVSEASPAIPAELHLESPKTQAHLSILRNTWFWISVCLAIFSAAIAVHFAWRPSQSTVAAHTSVLPWSAIFAEKREPLLVTSDPNIAEVQGLTNQPVSVSDYSNQRYIPNPSTLSPLLIHICRDVLRGDKAANVDTPIVATVARLASENALRIRVRAARDLHFSDFDTDSSLIFLGSPYTDPWTALFRDQLDFRFIYDQAKKQEIIENARPHPREPQQYVPTAKGFATGESFATISFIRNPNHTGNILILAGTDAEGTRAAGEFVATPATLSSALQRCGIHSSSSVTPQFQVLLLVHTMAGSPTAYDVAACHMLP